MNIRQHPLWFTYRNMKERCTQPSNKSYRNYGARGIKICDRWMERKGFWNFVKDMGDKPSGYTLDRINNDGDYSPDNCRWASQSVQKHNTRMYASNKSGVRGVSWSKDAERWYAKIQVEGIIHSIGYFRTLKEATTARREAEARLLSS